MSMSNRHIIALKFTQCFMSVVSQESWEKMIMTIFNAMPICNSLTNYSGVFKLSILVGKPSLSDEKGVQFTGGVIEKCKTLHFTKKNTFSVSSLSSGKVEK